MVNIAVHGHVPLLAEKVVEWAGKLEGEAPKVGAQGINIVGVCCSGNELLMRKGVNVATNYASQEMPIITGAWMPWLWIFNASCPVYSRWPSATILSLLLPSPTPRFQVPPILSFPQRKPMRLQGK
ncbi:hypothetical protein N752_26105 [Desulforamulus aquiferis]|nr:hypothetical protein N752_26105 [Desulforamulus aquiferis]